MYQQGQEDSEATAPEMAARARPRRSPGCASQRHDPDGTCVLWISPEHPQGTSVATSAQGVHVVTLQRPWHHHHVHQQKCVLSTMMRQRWTPWAVSCIWVQRRRAATEAGLSLISTSQSHQGHEMQHLHHAQASTLDARRYPESCLWDLSPSTPSPNRRQCRMCDENEPTPRLSNLTRKP